MALAAGAPHSGQPQLVRGLTLWDATMLAIGSVIGSGIFLTTGTIAERLPSAPQVLLVWAAGGVISLLGALSFAELGAMLPSTGGNYVYLREAYGRLPAFLFGWAIFLVIQTGSIAAVAVGFAEYLGYFWPAVSVERVLVTVPIRSSLGISAGQIVAVAVILGLSGINILGVKVGGRAQSVMTALKVAAIAALILIGASSHAAAAPALLPVRLPVGGAAAFGVAMIAVLWTFDGWYTVTWAAGEIERPQRSLPVALTAGVAIVTVVYLAVNYVYLMALPIDQLRGVARVAERAASALYGGAAARAVSGAVLLSTFGCVASLILSGPRVYFAMAADGLFFRRLAAVHPRYRTPAWSIGVQAIWSALLTLSGSYDQLFTYVMFAAALSYLATGLALFVLRRMQPARQRPYRALGYPVLPGLYVLATAWFVVNTLIERPVESGIGVGLLALGGPAYWYWRRAELRAETS